MRYYQEKMCDAEESMEYTSHEEVFGVATTFNPVLDSSPATAIDIDEEKTCIQLPNEPSRTLITPSKVISKKTSPFKIIKSDIVTIIKSKHVTQNSALIHIQQQQSKSPTTSSSSSLVINNNILSSSVHYGASKDLLASIIAFKYISSSSTAVLSSQELVQYETNAYELGGFLSTVIILPLDLQLQGLVRSNRKDAECTAAQVALGSKQVQDIYLEANNQLSQFSAFSQEFIGKFHQQEEQAMMTEVNVAQVDYVRDDDVSLINGNNCVNNYDDNVDHDDNDKIVNIEESSKCNATPKMPDASIPTTHPYSDLNAENNSQSMVITSAKEQLSELLLRYLCCNGKDVVHYNTEVLHSLIVFPHDGFVSKVSIPLLGIINIQGKQEATKKLAEISAAAVVLRLDHLFSTLEQYKVINSIPKIVQITPIASIGVENAKGQLQEIIMKSTKGSNPIQYITLPSIVSGKEKGFQSTLIMECYNISIQGPICATKKEAEKQVAALVLSHDVVVELNRQLQLKTINKMSKKRLLVDNAQ